MIVFTLCCLLALAESRSLPPEIPSGETESDINNQPPEKITTTTTTTTTIAALPPSPPTTKSPLAKKPPKQIPTRIPKKEHRVDKEIEEVEDFDVEIIEDKEIKLNADSFVNYYVAAGERVEIFPSELNTVIGFSIIPPPVVKFDRALQLLKIVENSQNQNIIRFNLDPSSILSGTATNVNKTYEITKNTLKSLYSSVEFIRKYFSGRTPTLAVKPACNIEIPWVGASEQIEAALASIAATDKVNEIINKGFTLNGKGGLVPGTTRPGAKNEGISLIATQSTIYEVNYRLERLSQEVMEYLTNLEQLMNKIIPPKFLVALETATTCTEKRTQDIPSVTNCEMGRRKAICYVEILQKGEGEIAHELIPIPYHHEGKTLRLEFPPNTVFKKNTGLILDISSCERHAEIVRCSNAQFEADECLEQVNKGKVLKEIPSACKVVRVAPARPLIIPVDSGHLIAQQNDQAVVIQYGDTSITDDPVIISNSRPFEVTYGKEKIKVPSFRHNPLDVAFSPRGNFTLLVEALDLLPWQEYWEKFIPIDARQLMLIIVAAIQIMTLGPCMLGYLDLLFSCIGFELIPRPERRWFKRYRLRRDDSYYDDSIANRDEISLPMMPRRNSMSSHHSRMSRRSLASLASNHSDLSPSAAQSLNRIRTIRALQNHYDSGY